jgi:hypothetical protein
MTLPSRLTAVAAVIVTLALGSDALAQARPTITIGKITAHQNCKVYQESEGHSAMVARRDTVVASQDKAAAVATRDGMAAERQNTTVAASRTTVAAVSSWRTWLVKDCTNDFPTIRNSLQAALAASGKLAVTGGGGRYVLSGAISQVGGGDEPATQTMSTGGFSVASQSIFVTMDVTLKDGSGRIVYGGSLTKHLEIGSNIQTAGMESGSSMSGEATYSQLQSQVALAVARLAAFHIVPLQVAGKEGDQIRVNYGAPLVPLGMVLHATSPDGFASVRYDVTSASADGAIAQKQGDGDSSRIEIGSPVAATEPGDPEGRAYQRVDLP